MRERLVTFLLDRTLPVTRPDEGFFSAGPHTATVQPSDRGQRDALLASLRRRRASVA